MNVFLNWLSQPYALLLCITIVFFLVIIPLYVRMSRLRKAMGTRLEDMESKINEGLREILETTATERGADREELGNNLRGMSDSVVRIMSEMSRTQQQQLDSFGGQIRAMSRTDEEHMDRMRSGINERLFDYDRQMSRVAQILEEKFTTNDRRLADMRQLLSEGLVRIQSGIDQKIDLVRETIDGKPAPSADKRLDESFKAVTDRLDQAYQGLGEMQSLAAGMSDITGVLTSPKVRGVWEQVPLDALLRQALSAEQYEKDAIVGMRQKRIEYAIRLPGGISGGFTSLPIATDLPMEEYKRLLDAREAEGKALYLHTSLQSIAKRVRSDYISLPQTTDFVLLYFPMEGIFAEILRQDGLAQQLQSEYNVIVTGPTTLLALLQSLQMNFRAMAFERRSSEVWAQLGVIKSEFGRFADLVSKTQQQLNQPPASIEEVSRKARSPQRRIQGVQDGGEREGKRMVEDADNTGKIKRISYLDSEGV